MKIRKVIVALLVVVGLSACGGSSSSSSASSGPYYNMETLAKGIEESVTTKNPALFAGTQITCIQSGKQTAECHASNGEGKEASVEVTISLDGQSFITH